MTTLMPIGHFAPRSSSTRTDFFELPKNRVIRVKNQLDYFYNKALVLKNKELKCSAKTELKDYLDVAQDIKNIVKTFISESSAYGTFDENIVNICERELLSIKLSYFKLEANPLSDQEKYMEMKDIFDEILQYDSNIIGHETASMINEKPQMLEPKKLHEKSSQDHDYKKYFNFLYTLGRVILFGDLPEGGVDAIRYLEENHNSDSNEPNRKNDDNSPKPSDVDSSAKEETNENVEETEIKSEENSTNTELHSTCFNLGLCQKVEVSETDGSLTHTCIECSGLIANIDFSGAYSAF